MGRTESLNLKKDYERACGWYGHFNKSEMALFSECTDRYAQKLLDTAGIVREAMFQQPDCELFWTALKIRSPNRMSVIAILRQLTFHGSNGCLPSVEFLDGLALKALN